MSPCGLCRVLAASLVLGGMIATPGCRTAVTASADKSSRVRQLDAEVGDEVCQADGLPWRQSASRTVLIVGSATCSACALDEPAEERVVRQCATRHVPVVYVLPIQHTEDERERQLRSMHRDVARINLGRLGISRTPSMAAINDQGQVISIWVGTVPKKPN